MTKQELINECDMLEGNVSRMMVTNNVDELIDMYERAKKRLDRILTENRNRITKIKEKKSVKNEAPFALTTHYNFDPDIPIWLFETEKEACEELERQFKEEIRIQTEECDHIEGQDLEAKKSDDWTEATISIFFKDAEGIDTADIMEWNVVQVKNDIGIFKKNS